MHFDMHVCLLEKVLLCSFDSKNILEVEKWAQFDPKMGSKNGTQKGGPIFFWLKKDYKKSKLYLKYWVSLLGAILDPILGSNSGTIFGSIFQPPFWGPKMVQILQKLLLSKLHSKTFSSK